MAQFLLELSYCGDGLYGFQSQPSGNTVQDHLEAALATFLRHPVRIMGSSRTDSGVHARQQFAVFRTDVDFEPTKLVLALHALMPAAIGVLSVVPVADSFHPIRDAKAKLYSYKLWTSPFRDALIFPRCWWVKSSISIDAMRQASGCLVGRHDFASFCSADSSAKTTVRRLYDIRIRQEGHMVEVWVLGEGFLKQMVRAIVGTLVTVAKVDRLPARALACVPAGPKSAELSQMARILAARDRSAAGVTAPGRGLTLERVFFQPVTMISDPLLDH